MNTFNWAVGKVLFDRRLWLLLPVIGLAGCNRNDIAVYRIAKETAAPQAAAQSVVAHGDLQGETEVPQLKWKLPAGWQERPATSMRAATFAVSGSEGRTAEVSVI